MYFARVHRVFGARQRRRVEPAQSAEQVFATFWSEAAVLAGDDSDARICSALAEEVDQPEDAISSLVVLPALDDAETYRAVRQTLALGIATLGLAESFTLSAFHPKDTFQVQVADDGSRSWEMSLPHPLVHLVRKK